MLINLTIWLYLTDHLFFLPVKGRQLWSQIVQFKNNKLFQKFLCFWLYPHQGKLISLTLKTKDVFKADYWKSFVTKMRPLRQFKSLKGKICLREQESSLSLKLSTDNLRKVWLMWRKSEYSSYVSLKINNSQSDRVLIMTKTSSVE